MEVPGGFGPRCAPAQPRASEQTPSVTTARRGPVAKRPRSVANHAVRSVWLLASLITLSGVTASCSRDKRSGDGGAGLGTTPPSLPAAHRSNEDEPAKAPPEATKPAEGAPEPSAHPEVVAAAPDSSSWSLGELSDIGPAGPASAWTRGVVMVSKANELVVLPVDGAGRFRELDADTASFAKYGRGPALTDRFAYWIDQRGRLLRAPLEDPKKVDVLHASARVGTRVAAVRSGERELVAFVAEQDDAPVSMLWASSGELLRLSPDEATATSVALVALDRALLAFTLAGRTGMSPVHARVVRVAARRVSLAEDRVIWVGPGSHPLTELEVTASGNPSGNERAFAFLAAASSITEFGLAHFPVTPDLPPLDEVRWSRYPNGIDPAPVAAARLCGKAYVFHARPSTAQPRSPQELRVAPIEGDTLGASEVVARARAFNDISVAQRPGGAILVWTGDRRTWAMTLGCPPTRLRGEPLRGAPPTEK